MIQEIKLKVMLTGDKETYLVRSIGNTVAQVHIGEPMFEAISRAFALRLKNSKRIGKSVYCPDCGSKTKMTDIRETEWYGILKYYRCRKCKETFVSQNDGELEIAAP